MSANLKSRLNNAMEELLEVETNVKKLLEELRLKEEKQQKLEEMMTERSEKANKKIVLDVGGQRFATSKETLLRFPNTYFSALLQSNSWKPDADGSYFIDRSPATFPIILEYLRHGVFKMNLVKDRLKEELIADLDYFQIDIPEALTTLTFLRLFLEHRKTIEPWLGKQKKVAKLLFDSLEMGMNQTIFHSRCNGQGTLAIVETVEGWVMAAYTDAYSKESWGSSKENFFLSIKNPNNRTTKYSISDQNYLFLDIYQRLNTRIAGFPFSFYDQSCTLTGSQGLNIKIVEAYQVLNV